MVLNSYMYEGAYEDPVFFSYPKQTIDGANLIATKFSRKHIGRALGILEFSKIAAKYAGNIDPDTLPSLVNESPFDSIAGKPTSNPPPKEVKEKALETIAYAQRHIPVEEREVMLAILNELGECVGLLHLFNIHWVNRTASCSVLLSESIINEELKSEAVSLLQTYSFDVLNLRIISVNISENDKHIYDLAGFEQAGHIEEYWINATTNRREDVYIMYKSSPR